MTQTTQIEYKNEKFSSDTMNALYKQKVLNLHCDLTLNINNLKELNVHSNVMACSTSYFDGKFKNHKMKRRLQISCNDIKIFESMIDFMYNGQITICDENIEELLQLSSYFSLEKLIEYCIDYLKKVLSVKNCFRIRDLCISYEVNQLNEMIRDFIRCRIKDICKESEISKFDSQKLINFITDKDYALPITHYLELIASWLSYDINTRSSEFAKMLLLLDWSQCDSVDMFTHLDTCPLYTMSEMSLYYVLRHLNTNNIFIPTYETKFQKLKEQYEQNVFMNNNIESIENIHEFEIPKKFDVKVEIDNYSDTVKSKRKQCKKKIVKRITLYRSNKPGLRLSLVKSTSTQNRIFRISKDKSNEEDLNSNSQVLGILCKFCSQVLTDTQALEHHLSTEHSKDITYKCGICNFTCQWNNKYLEHMKEHFPGPQFKCESCDYNTEDLPDLLLHRVKHCEENMYQCTFCTFKCREKQNFVAHLRIHCPDKPYKCEQCEATFRLQHLLDSHMLTHSNEEPNLTCEFCGFTTKFLSHLIAHKRIHNTELHRCTYPHCKYSTPKKSQLLNHAKMHNGTRPHTCNTCGRGFMEKSHLVRHERIHLDEKPFKCNHCDYASSRRDKLKEHCSRHHGETVSPKGPYKSRPIKNSQVNTLQNLENRPKQQLQEQNASSVTYPSSGSSGSSSIAPPINNDIQELIMHHQALPSTSVSNNITTLNSNYHHFPDTGEFHGHAPHGLPHSVLPPHSQAPTSHHPRPHPATSTTAAAVAAAMMLDPRFHHNTAVPYHSATTPVSMAMAAVQSSQHIQGPVQHGEYPPSLQTCMSLF